MKSTRTFANGIVSCAFLFLAIQPGVAYAQLTELFAFPYNAATTSNFPDGENPMAELIQAADGNYYTTTNTGGAGTCPGEVEDQIPGCGAVVKITPAGVLSVVYSFTYDSSTSNPPNGWEPQAGLVQAKDGNFYGVATLGGVSNPICGTAGCGTVFKLTPKGTLTLLHAFCGGNGCGSLATDGADPTGRLVVGPSGDLYGTTQTGGVYEGFYNQGTIFRITTSGVYEILHIFTGPFGPVVDGANPVAGLTLGSDGNFYGTTETGGSGGQDAGEGTVFKMTPAGKITILHSFVGNEASSPDGSYPLGALVQASDGNLYGTCYSGGVNGTGTAFRISTKGVFTKIYDYAAEAVPDSIGNLPRAGFIQGSDGNLYGTAWEGGAFVTTGTIYQMTLDGVGTLEASFDASTTGFSPLDAVVQGSDGKLYVTLQNNGGANSDGVQDQGAISVLNAGLPTPAPKIVSFPAKVKPGAKITILGGNFIGTTAVTFSDNVPAVFVVDGSGVMTVTVPATAVTGPISITNSGGKTTTTKSLTVS